MNTDYEIIARRKIAGDSVIIAALLHDTCKADMAALFDECNAEYFGGVLKKCRYSLFKTVMIHEMIHHYLRSVKHSSGGLFRHNWRFRRQCRRLKRDYGIIIHIHFRRVSLPYRMRWP